MNGSTALHVAVYFGRNKMKTFQALLKNKKTSLDVLNHGGGFDLVKRCGFCGLERGYREISSFSTLKYGVNHRRKSSNNKVETHLQSRTRTFEVSL